MNILFYRWNSNCEPLVLKALEKIADNIVICNKSCQDYNMDLELIQELLTKIHKEKVDFVFSLNFYPTIAQACEVANVIYISWTFDSPALPLYSKASLLKCNRLFIFDKSEYEKLLSLGRKNLWHMPLASSPDYFSEFIEEKSEYDYSVSFVGSLYTNNQYDKYFQESDDSYLNGYCQGIMSAQKQIFGASIIEESLDNSRALELLDKLNISAINGYDISEVFLATYALERKISSDERKHYINIIANYLASLKDYNEGKFALFSNDSLDNENVMNLGYISYELEMPKVFRKSKINLNFTVRNIHSGIPLRVFDVLACKGFLMMPYQAEIPDLFSDGEDLVLFFDEKDMLEKIDYYLKHDDEREKIALSGYKKIKEYFSYEKVLKDIINKI